MAVALVVLAVGLPALAFTLWPLLRGRDDDAAGARVEVDTREGWLERKRRALRALRELEFEHEAGHIAPDDYAALRARYEAEAAAALAALDRLGPPPAPRPAAAAAPARAPRAAAWRHPLALATSAVLLVLFGVALGAGIVRHTAPDPLAGLPMPGSRPLATLDPAPAAGTPGTRSVPPAMLAGMLEAARASLLAGRYDEAIAAYKAVLARDPRNVDALTHLGLILAIGGHADGALETFDRALALQPDYPPALLYRGQVLLEAKQDTAGALAAWERFVAVVPPGEDRARVERMIAEVRARRAPAGKR